MGQTASVDAHSISPSKARSRASTLKSSRPSFKAEKTPRMSLPEYKHQLTLTQYDVKQLMKAYHEALERGDTHTTSSCESEAEDEIIDQIHEQFGTGPVPRTILKSTTSNVSEDSGIDETTHSPRLSVDDLNSLPSFEKELGQNTPKAQTPGTPLVIPELVF
ncbi:unnamed protein product, partial [Strongylus vulgaris]